MTKVHDNILTPDLIDFYLDVVRIPSLFTDRSEGNAELHDLFEYLYVSQDIADSYMATKQSIKYNANYHFLHRDVYSQESEDYLCRLVASADCSFSGRIKDSDFGSFAVSGSVMIKILSNGQFKAICPVCASRINTFLDIGCLDICEHELALLIGLDYCMNLNNRYNATMRTKRLEAMKTRRARLERIKGIDPKKIMTLACGVSNIEKDFSTCGSCR